MDGYRAATFGDVIADIYDSHYALEVRPSKEKVELLTRLAARGPVLDVGCGTGWMAIALAQNGLQVTGVDSSSQMLEQLRRNDPDGLVECQLADVTTQPIHGEYALAYALFETLIMVGDHSAQRVALENIARVLQPGGVLLVEVSVMELDRWSDHVDSSVRVTAMSADHVGIGLSKYDRATGRLDYQDVLISGSGIRLLPVTMHPTNPQQLSDMANACGLRKESHCSDWAGTKYAKGMPSLIAVYRRR